MLSPNLEDGPNWYPPPAVLARRGFVYNYFLLRFEAVITIAFSSCAIDDRSNSEVKSVVSVFRGNAVADNRTGSDVESVSGVVVGTKLRQPRAAASTGTHTTAVHVTDGAIANQRAIGTAVQPDPCRRPGWPAVKAWPSSRTGDRAGDFKAAQVECDVGPVNLDGDGVWDRCEVEVTR